MITSFTSQLISLQGVGISRQGGRPENQDDWGYVDTSLGFLLVVCDGMGGGPGGKTASFIAKNEFMAALQGCSAQASRVDAMKMAVSRANDALYQKMDDEPMLKGMGSTLVAVLISPQSAVVAHLGDSRCYRISHERIAFRTDDHSLVGELVRNKSLTEEQARTSPQSNVIMRGLGNTSNHVPEIAEIPYRKGDRFVLCTDGVWGIMPHEQLVQRLTSQQELTALVGNLAAEVDQIGFSAGGHHDNHTLAAVEINTDSILKDTMNKIVKITVAVLAALLVVSIAIIVACTVKLGSATSKIAELEQRNQELVNKNKNQITRIAVKDGNTKELMTEVIVLKSEKEQLEKQLEESQNALKEKVDSLEKVVQEYQHKLTLAKQNATKPVKSDNKKTLRK